MYKNDEIAEKNAVCKVMYIKDQEKYKKYRIDEWLRKKMAEKYNEDDIDNPLLRIDVKFDELNPDAQIELLGFAKGYILMGKSLPLKKELWALLEMGNSEVWKEIEEFNQRHRELMELIERAGRKE